MPDDDYVFVCKLHNNDSKIVVELCLRKPDLIRVVKKSIHWDKRHWAAKEIATMAVIGNHPHITQMIEYYMKDNSICIIYAFCDRGDLFDYLKMHQDDVTHDHIKAFFKDVLIGVLHMHSNNVIHRDIKLENVVVDQDGRARLCDFSFCEWAKEPKIDYNTHGLLANENGIEVDNNKALSKFDIDVLGTLGCISPEVIETCKASEKSDIYSLGIMLFEMMTGKRLTPTFSKKNAKNAYKATTLPEFKMSAELIDLLHKLLHPDPKKRISIEDTLAHPFMKRTCE